MNRPQLPAVIRSLVGTWEGSGTGRYPTIEPFDYDERVTIAAPPAKPFLRYEQVTWRPGRPEETMHVEVGYFRPGRDGMVEWVIAQPTGIAETLVGEISGDSVRFDSTGVGRAPAAKRVDRTTRILVPTAGELAYEMWMTAVGQAHQIHLEATLRRSD